METPENQTAPFADGSLRFEFIEGDVSHIPEPHDTGWRELPCAVCAQIFRGRVRLSLADDSTHELGDGDAFLLQAGDRNRVESISDRPLDSRWAHFRLTMLGTVDALAFFDLPRVVRGDAAGRLGDICERLAETRRASAGPHLKHALDGSAAGFALAAAIAEISEFREDAHAAMGTMGRLAPVFTALHEDLAGTHALDDLARMVHLSPSRFHALFKKTIGLAPLEYLQGLRLDMAKRLLIESDLGIAQIATRVGYADPFHFSRTFKRRTGLSPRHYREEVRSGLWSGPAPATGQNS